MAARGRFQRFAHGVSRTAGNAFTFGLALAVIVGWTVTGPIFHFSDTWQLVINTSTTIVGRGQPDTGTEEVREHV